VRQPTIKFESTMTMAPTWLLLLSCMHVSHEDTVLFTQAFGMNEMHRGPWKMNASWAFIVPRWLPGFCHKAKVKIMLSAKERIEYVKQRESNMFLRRSNASNYL
jgi:hypothetical protein